MTNSQLCFLLANLWLMMPSPIANSGINLVLGGIFIVLTFMTREKKKADE